MGNRGQAQWFRSTSASSIGIEIALAIVVGTFAGKWIQDRNPEWSPWALFIGLAFGCVAAVGAVKRTLRSYQKELDMVEGEQLDAQIENSHSESKQERTQAIVAKDHSPDKTEGDSIAGAGRVLAESKDSSQENRQSGAPRFDSKSIAADNRGKRG